MRGGQSHSTTHLPLKSFPVVVLTLLHGVSRGLTCVMKNCPLRTGIQRRNSGAGSVFLGDSLTYKRELGKQDKRVLY